MGNILPFSGIDFFVIAFLFVGFIHISKELLLSYISFEKLLFIATLAYMIFLLPLSSTRAILEFLLYTYFIYWLFTKKDNINILIPSIIIALPLILYKLDIGPMYKIIGISYITFRTVQAIIDSHNYGKLNFFEFTSFLLFPTTLLAGPIDRSYRFQEDLKKGYANITLTNLFKGWDILIVGVLFKFVFAEFINHYWLMPIDVSSQESLEMLNSAYAYTTYLFFDFAGYSAMAVGLSIMIGINVPMNFNHPYLAQNPQDFWRRFHITLGSWLTDYFFKPIYKSLHQFSFLKGRRLLIQNIAIIATFLLMGMWNGLTWYYIFSGFLFGLYSALHNIYVVHVRKGGFDVFAVFPEIVSINLKRFLMLNSAVLALYFFSGRIPI